MGLRLRFYDDGTTVRARFTPGADHVGFKQVTHGGLLATVLDEIMVWACAVRTRRFAYCAELTVRFLHPVRPGLDLTAIGRLMENRRGRLFQAGGELVDPSGTIVASSIGKYLPIQDANTKAMKEDFVGDQAGLFD